MSGHIVAIGGGDLAGGPIEDLLLELAGVTRPRVCYIGTASAHKPEYLDTFYDSFRQRTCEPTHLELFQRAPTIHRKEGVVECHFNFPP